MRQLKWDVPFASLDPLSLGIASAQFDGGVWTVRVELNDQTRFWSVRFWGVVGVRFSDESFFDWGHWHNSFENTLGGAAYIIEDGAMRSDFWTGNDGPISTTHFAIGTANALFEALAQQWDVSDETR